MIVVGLIALAVISEPSGAPVRVTGSTACPTPAEVESAVAGMIGPRDATAAPDVATLGEDAQTIVVTLRRGSGDVIGEKRLEVGLSCEQRGRAAAVVIAAWEARFGAQPTNLVVPPAAPMEEDTAVVRRADDVPSRASERFRVEPGVSLGAAVNGTTLAPAGTIEVAFSRPGGTVVPAIGALAVGAHTMRVGPGDGNWRRYGLLAVVGSRRTWTSTWLEARIGVALTLLDISGSSFQRNASGVTVDPGVPIGVRFGVRTGPMRWWTDATVAFWPRSQTLFVDGSSGSATLPRGEALLSLGASYGAP